MAPVSHRLPLPALAAVMERSGGLSDELFLMMRSVEWPGASHVLLICLREQNVFWWWLLPSRLWGRWPRGDERLDWKTGMLGLGAEGHGRKEQNSRLVKLKGWYASGKKSTANRNRAASHHRSGICFLQLETIHRYWPLVRCKKLTEKMCPLFLEPHYLLLVVFLT